MMPTGISRNAALAAFQTTHPFAPIDLDTLANVIRGLSAYWQATGRLAEGEAMLYDALDRHDSELVIEVFVQPDRVSHMFWRGFDPQHPSYADSSALARGAIPWIYAWPGRPSRLQSPSG